MNMQYHGNSSDSWGLLDGDRLVLAVQHHNGMNVGLMVNDGDRFGEPLNAVPPALPKPADISRITQQDTLVLQELRLDCELLLKAQSVAAKPQSQYKAETFLLPQEELAQLNSASAKLVALQGRMKLVDRVERDLDLARRQPAGIMNLQQAVKPAEGQLEAAALPAGIMEIVQSDVRPRQPTQRRISLCTARKARTVEYACACASRIACVPA